MKKNFGVQQLRILTSLRDDGPQTTAELCKRLGLILGKPFYVRFSQLKKRGLITQARKGEPVILTLAGREKLTRLAEPPIFLAAPEEGYRAPLASEPFDFASSPEQWKYLAEARGERIRVLRQLLLEVSQYANPLPDPLRLRLGDERGDT